MPAEGETLRAVRLACQADCKSVSSKFTFKWDSVTPKALCSQAISATLTRRLLTVMMPFERTFERPERHDPKELRPMGFLSDGVSDA